MRGRDKAVQGCVEYERCHRCEVQCSTVHSGTVQYCTLQYSTVQYTAARHCLPQHCSGHCRVSRTAPSVPLPPPVLGGKHYLTQHCAALCYTTPISWLDWTGVEDCVWATIHRYACRLYCTVMYLYCTCAVIYRAALLASQTVSPSVRLFPIFTLYTSDVTGRSGLFGSNQRTLDLRSWTLDLDSWRCPLVLWVRRGSRNGLTSETA